MNYNYNNNLLSFYTLTTETLNKRFSRLGFFRLESSSKRSRIYKMSQAHEQNQLQNKPAKSSSSSSSFSLFLKLFTHPFKIFFQNKHILFPVFLFLAFPLSFILFALSFTSRPLKHHIFHLESVALRSPTRFEARHVFIESREESFELLRLKILFSFPSSIISLISFISTVHVTSLSPPLHPSFLSTAASLRLSWKRVFVTSLCSYAVFIFYIQLPQLLAAAFRSNPRLSLPILVIGSVFEVYLMGVLGLGLVVSALEETYGLDAIFVGSNLAVGRRFCWWCVTCMLVAVSGWIGSRFDKLTSGGDSVWTVVMGWETLGLLCFYGVVIIWSFIITTIFYYDCKNRLRGVNNGPDESDANITNLHV